MGKELDLSSLPLESIPLSLVESIRAEVHSHDPVKWIEDILSGCVWSKQREIIESVRDNRLTVVYSCHGTGKSAIAAMLACWWVSTRPPGEAIVVTTATRAKQVKAILWKEIRKWHARGSLRGRLNQTEWWLPIRTESRDGDIIEHEELVAFGSKPADYDEEAFQGIHAPYVLFIGDEASGLPTELCVAGGSLTANDTSRYLLIGNPIDPTSYFAKKCRPSSGWSTIQIGYKDTPNFTDEPLPDEIKRSLIGPVYVEEMRREWGEQHPRYISRVEGKFPDVDDNNLIPIRWVRDALGRELDEAGDNELGIDVGAGGDWNIIAWRVGPVVRIISRNREPNTMTSLGNVVQAIRATGASRAKVDYIGIGKGIVDRAKEIVKESRARGDLDKAGLYSRIVGIDFRKSAIDNDSYHNLRAEAYYVVRNRFQTGDISITDEGGIAGTAEIVAGQFEGIKRKATSAGKEMILSKEDMIRSGDLKRSPDEADGVVLAFLPKPPRVRRKRPRAVGGRRLERAIGGTRRVR